MTASWGPRPCPDEVDGLILFDGVCVFCSRWVRWVIAHDPEGVFRFTSMQSPRGRALAVRYGIDPDAPQTNAVVLDGMIRFKSDAAIAVVSRLPGWGAARCASILPRRFRDALYDPVARNRYRLFGRSDACMVPSAADRARFVE